MKLVKKITLEQTETFNNSDLCIATEYDFKDKDMLVTINSLNFYLKYKNKKL